MKRLILAFALCLAWSAAPALGGGCDRCGCACQPKKVCRLVCEMKEIKHTKYGCCPEDFCTLGPECKSCGCNCDCPKPTCGAVRTRMKLMKYEVVERKPVYKCVVEYLCPTCCHGCECQTPAANVEFAEPPLPQPVAVPPQASLFDRLRLPSLSSRGR